MSYETDVNIETRRSNPSWKVSAAIVVIGGLLAAGLTGASATDDVNGNAAEISAYSEAGAVAGSLPGGAVPPEGATIVLAEGPVDEADLAAAEAITEPLLDATEFGEAPSFDAEAALAAGVSPQQVADYAAVLESYSGQATGSAPSSASQAVERSFEALAACEGRSGYTGFWWTIGAQWALNSCQTAQLIAYAGLGAGGAGAAAALLAASGVGAPASAVAGVAAALVTLGAGFLVVCQANSSLSAIYLNGGTATSGSLPPSCW